MFINKTPEGLNNICGKNIARLRTNLQISQRELANVCSSSESISIKTQSSGLNAEKDLSPI